MPERLFLQNKYQKHHLSFAKTQREIASIFPYSELLFEQDGKRRAHLTTAPSIALQPYRRKIGMKLLVGERLFWPARMIKMTGQRGARSFRLTYLFNI